MKGIIIFQVICLLSACAQKSEIEQQKEATKESYQLIAHRGGIVEEYFNEFDPQSIQAAIDSGYYMLEIDVHQSKDGILVVNHDNTFDRFFNHPGKVSEMTWAEIQKLRSTKGNHAPQSFEEVAQMCSGKVKMMIDVKSNPATPVYFEKLGNIMTQYDLLEGAYFINKEAKDYFWGKAKFEFRVPETMEMKNRLENGEDIASNYFLFDHGNRLTAEAVKFCQLNEIAVVVSVNISHYKFENHMQGAERDIAYWKACGVEQYQIDSDYDQWLR